MNFRYTYSVSQWNNGRNETYTSTWLHSQCVQLGLTNHAQQLSELMTHGMRYSNQDYDVCASALRAIDRATG